MNTPMEKIQGAARNFAAAHAKLSDLVKRRDELKALIELHPELFDKPKTPPVNGVKFGLRKQPGGLDWEEKDDVIVARIKRQFGEAAPRYLRTREIPNREALENLPATDLKKIGVSVVRDGTKTIVDLVDGEIEKSVAALLEETEA